MRRFVYDFSVREREPTAGFTNEDLSFILTAFHHQVDLFIRGKKKRMNHLVKKSWNSFLFLSNVKSRAWYMIICYPFLWNVDHYPCVSCAKVLDYFLSKAFRQSGIPEYRNFLIEHLIISYVRSPSILYPRSMDGHRRWILGNLGLAAIARPVGYIISGGSPGIFVARRENGGDGLGERWHHSSTWDQGRRRACRTLLLKDLLNALARVRVYLIRIRECFRSRQQFSRSVISHTYFIMFIN